MRAIHSHHHPAPNRTHNLVGADDRETVWALAGVSLDPRRQAPHIAGSLTVRPDGVPTTLLLAVEERPHGEAHVLDLRFAGHERDGRLRFVDASGHPAVRARVNGLFGRRTQVLSLTLDVEFAPRSVGRKGKPTTIEVNGTVALQR